MRDKFDNWLLGRAFKKQARNIVEYFASGYKKLALERMQEYMSRYSGPIAS